MSKIVRGLFTIFVGMFVYLTYVETGALFALPNNLKAIIFGALGIFLLIHFSFLLGVADKTSRERGSNFSMPVLGLSMLVAYGLSYLIICLVVWFVGLFVVIPNLWVCSLVMLMTDIVFMTLFRIDLSNT